MTDCQTILRSPSSFSARQDTSIPIKKKHLIIEFRRNDFEICKPKHITGKAHWYSRERNWLVHYTGDRDVDIRELK